jgi:hypothetical protein
MDPAGNTESREDLIVAEAFGGVIPLSTRQNVKGNQVLIHSSSVVPQGYLFRDCSAE